MSVLSLAFFIIENIPFLNVKYFFFSKSIFLILIASFHCFLNANQSSFIISLILPLYTVPVNIFHPCNVTLFFWKSYDFIFLTMFSCVLISDHMVSPLLHFRVYQSLYYLLNIERTEGSPTSSISMSSQALLDDGSTWNRIATHSPHVLNGLILWPCNNPILAGQSTDL